RDAVLPAGDLHRRAGRAEGGGVAGRQVRLPGGLVGRRHDRVQVLGGQRLVDRALGGRGRVPPGGGVGRVAAIAGRRLRGGEDLLLEERHLGGRVRLVEGDQPGQVAR